MAVKTAIPCLAAMDAYPRMAYRSRVVFSERSRPRSSAGFSRAAGRVRPGCWWGDRGVGEEPQHVGFAVPQAFQQRPGRRLPALGAGDAADLDSPTVTPRRNSLRCSAAGLAVDGGQALVTGQVRLVDEAAQPAGDLAGPDRVRVGLGGVLDVAEQMGCTTGG